MMDADFRRNRLTDELSLLGRRIGIAIKLRLVLENYSVDKSLVVLNCTIGRGTQLGVVSRLFLPPLERG
jgi:hypothetical protein